MSTFQTRTKNVNRFGSAGRRLLSTSAIAVVSLAALSVGQSASADTGPWTEWDSQNNFTVQSNGQTTDIHTTANIAGGNSPDLDIDAGEAVNVFQQGSGSLFYGRAADDADPTQILGALWSNGRLLIIDRNGVFFGPGSQIDTAGIVASTGDISDADIFDGDNKFSFDNFGEGAITIEGTVNVGQAGLAAFVSPTVVNNGVINAKMGTVSFAAGEKVTLDLYGDGLVEVAVEGELADALLENKGQINAAGGTVQMSALAAKGAVDNIVNMDGVITVASAEVKGGKIILSGGDSGKVAVSGKLDASGTTGGEIDVTGQNVEIAGTAELSADATDGNGDGGRVEIIAQDKAIFRGLISARGGDVSGQGGFVDTSGLGAIDVAGGVVDTRASNGTAGLWLIDPTDITVVFSVPGPLDPVPTTNSTIGWNQIMAALGLSNITIRTDGGAGGNGDIFFGATTPSNSITSLFRPSGENRDLTFDADRNIVVNEGLNFSGVGTLNLNAGGRLILNKDLTVVDIFDGVLNPDDGIAQGNLNITTAEIDLFANLEVQRTLNSTATTVNVAQVPLSFGNTGAEIQDGVDVAAAGGTVNVGAGTYHEDVIIDKALTLNGANSGLHGNDGGRGPESIVTPGTVGFLITGNNTVIDGFEIVGGEAGVIVDGGNNAIIRNNNIHGQFAPSGEGASFGAPGEGDGVYVTNSAGTKILRNKIADYNDDGVQASGVSDFEIADNLIADNGNGDLAIGVSNASGSLDITGNEITNARRQGVQVLSSTVTANISGNTVANAATTQAGISIQGTNGDISIDDNTVSGGLIGINIHTSDNVLVGDKDGDNDSGNTVIGSGRGISVFGSTDTEVVDNTLTGVGSGIAGIQSENIQIVDNNVTGASTVGIDIIDSDSADVDNNIVTHFTTGIRVTNSDLVDIEGNTITDIAENGIEVSGSALVDVQDNAVGGASANDVGGDGIHIVSSLGADVRGNTVRNADGDGIELISSDSSNVGGFGGGDRNTIRNVGGHGIVSSFGTSPDILNNDVAFTGLNGIHLNGGTDAQVRRNLVDETGRDGIEANGNLDIQITDNRIGTRAGAGNIGGEGIDVNNSPSADILNNVVSNTVSNGISINPSHGSVIQGNTITNAGAHGILSSGSDNILIRSNRIDLTVLDGIRFANGNTVTIDGNRISNTGRGGIWAHNSSNVTIDNNSVLNAGTAQTWSGIVANNNDGVRITRNRVDTTSFDGIHAGFNPGNTGAANTNVVIDGNTVLNARVRGIYSVGGTLSASNNVVHDVGAQGLRIDNSAGVNIDTNIVYNTGNDGIELNNSAGANIRRNAVGYTDLAGTISAGADNIGGEGIDVNNSPATQILGNKVTETVSNGISINPSPGSVIQGNVITNAGADGILVVSSDNTLVGGPNAGDENTVTNSGQSGIRVHGSGDVTVERNIVNGTVVGGDHNGIFVTDSTGTNSVLSNRVSNAGWDGIKILNGPAQRVIGNVVTDSHLSGIAMFNTHNSLVQNNDVDRAGTWGLRLDNLDGSIVSGNEIDTTGNDGIETNSSDGIQILSNRIGTNGGVDNISGEGIDVNNSPNSTINNNVVTETVSNGISINPSPNSVIQGNVITNVGTDGILVTSSNNTLVGGYGAGEENTIINAGDDGVNIVGSENVFVVGNSITQTGDNGVEIVNGSHGALVDLNRIDQAGWDGVNVQNSNGVRTIRNTILNTVGASGVAVINSANNQVFGNRIDGAGRLGVYAGNADSILINNNGIANTGLSVALLGSGIHVENTENARILSNMISHAAHDGINLGDPINFGITGNTGAFIVDNNTINNTARDGIHAETTPNVQITNNKIGLLGGANNIGDEGIDVNNSPSADILGNLVSNTVSNGISINPSHGSVIQGNTITNAGAHGIFSTGSNNILIRSNQINLTGLDGIRFANGNTVRIDRNNISNTGRGGIWAHNSSNVTIDNNDVFNAGTATTWSGIVANNNDGVRITRNRVDTTSFDGIHAGFNPGNVAAANTNVVINGNTVQNALVRGIYSVGGTLSASRNTVHDTGFGQGIRIDNSAGVNIDRNIVYNTGSDGIELNDSAGANIRRNAVGYTNLAGTISGGVDNIGGEGIDVNHSNGVRIVGNRIIETQSNGISVNPSDNVLIQSNTVINAGADGIRSDGGTNLTVRNNFVRNAGDDGLDVNNNLGFVTVVGNTFRNNGDDGVEIDNTAGLVTVDRNHVHNNGGNGLEIDGNTNVRIRGNNIHHNRIDGIYVDDASVSLEIANNRVQRNGDEGIDIEDSGFITIANNLVTDNTNDGIELDDTGFVTIRNNRILDNGTQGIDITDSSFVDIDGNTIQRNADGMELVGVGFVTIQNNLITDNRDDGIVLDRAAFVRLLNNTISDNADRGLHARGAGNFDIALVGNTFNDNPIGAEFNSGGPIDISDLANPNVFNGGDVALRFAPAPVGRGGFAPMNLVGDTLGGTIFNGTGTLYVELRNGAFFNPGTPTIIDGTNATFDGIRPADTGGILPAAMLAAIEDKLNDFDDLNTLGQIFVGVEPAGLENIEDFFNQFGPFGAGLHGLNVTVTGLPPVALGGGAGGVQNLAGIEPAAGGEGGEGATGPQELAGIEPAAGGEEAGCWGDAMNAAASGTVVNFDWGGSFEESLADAAGCGASETF